MEISEIMAGLDQVDPKTFAAELKEHKPDLYQYIWNGGHKTATSDSKTKLDELNAQLQSFADEKEKLETKIASLSKDQPDTAELQKKYEDALIAKDSATEELKMKHKEELQRLKSKLQGSSLDRVRSDTIRDLVANGVDKDWADVWTQKKEFLDRLRIDEEGDVTGALQKDLQTPIPLSDGQSVASVLARELLSVVPDKFRDDTRQGGAGVGERGGRQRTYTEAELSKMQPDDFQKALGEIDKAAQEGRNILVG